MQSDLGALMAAAKASVFVVDDAESVREALGRLGTHATLAEVPGLSSAKPLTHLTALKP